MAKQKIVIKVIMENAKRRSKALTIAAGFFGVISTQIDGETIVVVGDGVDPIALTVKLRKKMSPKWKRCWSMCLIAKLVDVSEVEEKKEKKEEKKVEEANKGVQQIWPCQFPMAPPPYYICESRDSYNDGCSIM